jgi:DNA-binding MarR family transcriptional regulator
MLKDKPKKALYEFARQSVPCIGFNTRRATRLITQYYDKALAPARLRSTQYSLLSVLAMLGENSMQDLAFVLAMDRTTLTRNLNPLLKKGWVKIQVGSDRRARPLTITPAGQAVLENALPLWQRAQAHILDRIGEANWDAMMRGLHQISMIVEES